MGMSVSSRVYRSTSHTVIAVIQFEKKKCGNQVNSSTEVCLSVYSLFVADIMSTNVCTGGFK